MPDAIYIGRNGQQLGPYSKAQLAAMVAAGEILPGDVAWHEGMQAWQPASEVLALLGIGGTTQPPPLQAGATIIPPRHAPGATAYASADRVAAGNAPGKNLVAGLGARWLASIIDGLILMCISIGLGIAWGLIEVITGHRGGAGGFGLLLFTLLITLLYFTLTEGGERMASLGKRAMNMVVAGRNGQGISYGRAAVRYVLLLVSSNLLPLLLVMLFTPRRQGVHDLIVDSVVLERDSYDPQRWDYEHIEKSPRGGGALLVLAIGMVFGVFVVGLLAAIAIPAYQDYSLRARLQGVMVQADSIKAGVTRHYSSSNEPVQYSDIGMSGPLALPGDGGLIAVTSSGVINIMLGMPPLTGQSIRLTPTLSPTGISWTCASDDVKKQYLPQSCR